MRPYKLHNNSQQAEATEASKCHDLKKPTQPVDGQLQPCNLGLVPSAFPLSGLRHLTSRTVHVSPMKGCRACST